MEAPSSSLLRAKEEPLPLTPLEREAKNKSFRLLLQRLTNLPIELSLQILYQLDYQQLLLLCAELKDEEAPQSLKPLGRYCDDGVFWQDYLLAYGFLLPENFSELINSLRQEGESEAYIIKNFFFGTAAQQREILERVIIRWNKGIKERENLRRKRADKKDKVLEQLVLDIDYLLRQYNINQIRESFNRPIVFKLNFRIDDNFEKSGIRKALAKIEKISYPELLQICVDNDAKPVYIDSGYGWGFARLIEFNRISDQFAEQTYALTNDLLQEGDIVDLNLFKLDERKIFQLVAAYSYYFDGEFLYPIFIDIIGAELYLPPAAVLFLIRKNVQKLMELKDLYPSIGMVKVKGFRSPIDDKKIKLTSSSKGKPLKIQNHIFYIK